MILLYLLQTIPTSSLYLKTQTILYSFFFFKEFIKEPISCFARIVCLFFTLMEVRNSKGV